MKSVHFGSSWAVLAEAVVVAEETVETSPSG